MSLNEISLFDDKSWFSNWILRLNNRYNDVIRSPPTNFTQVGAILSKLGVLQKHVLNYFYIFSRKMPHCMKFSSLLFRNHNTWASNVVRAKIKCSSRYSLFRNLIKAQSREYWEIVVKGNFIYHKRSFYRFERHRNIVWPTEN